MVAILGMFSKYKVAVLLLLSLYLCYNLDMKVWVQIKNTVIITWKFNDRGQLYPHRGRYFVPTGYRHLEDELKETVPSCCNLIHINLVGRHGTRYPLNFLTKLENFLEREDFIPGLKKTLKNFREKWPHKSALTTRGKQEWVEFASRMKKYFAAFLNISKLTRSGGLVVEYDGSLGHHKETAFWYSHQLLKLDRKFDNDGPLNNMTPLTPTPENPSNLIKKYINIRKTIKTWQYSGCKKFYRFRLLQKHNRSKLVSSDMYLKNQANALTKKFCHKPGCVIDVQDVLKLYEMCGLQYLYTKHDSLCSDWPMKLLEKLAYVTDVTKYYDSSYGTGMAEDLACGMTGILVEDMQKAINGWKPSHVARMICQENILPLMTIGKIFPREDRLNWTAIPDENWERSFHLNELTPMAANLLFLVYDCSGCKTKTFKNSKIQNVMVLTLLNERLVKTPHNATDYLISFEDFIINFQPCGVQEFNSRCYIPR